MISSTLMTSSDGKFIFIFLDTKDTIKIAQSF